jgi:hypothetical protein
LLWALLGLLLTAVVAVLLYRAWPLLYPEVIAQAPLSRDCDLRSGPCRVSFDQGGAVVLDIRPRGIPLVSPLRLEVELVGIEPRGVEIDFAGVDMNMGFNRVTLGRSESGRYRGEGMLPVCVRDRMVWEARVMLNTSQGVMVAPFRFDTYRSSR